MAPKQARLFRSKEGTERREGPESTLTYEGFALRAGEVPAEVKFCPLPDVPGRPNAQATIPVVWTVEVQDRAGKWFRVTPKLFEGRDGAIEWCDTLRERWAESGPRSRLRIRLLTPEEMEKNKPRRKRRRWE